MCVAASVWLLAVQSWAGAGCWPWHFVGQLCPVWLAWCTLARPWCVRCLLGNHRQCLCAAADDSAAQISRPDGWTWLSHSQVYCCIQRCTKRSALRLSSFCGAVCTVGLAAMCLSAWVEGRGAGGCHLPESAVWDYCAGEGRGSCGWSQARQV